MKKQRLQPAVRNLAVFPDAPNTVLKLVKTKMIKISAFFRLLALGSAVTLGACTATLPTIDQKVKTVEQAQDIAISAQLDASIKRMENQPHWATSLDDRAALASFATDKVSVSYQGSAADLLKAISAARNMSFRVTGPSPHTPIFVFVEAVDQPFVEFLKDLSKQFGQRADVVWADQHFELRYR